MNILFLCGREADYPLNRFLIESMRQFASVNVLDENGSGSSILKRSLRVFSKALPELLVNHYDLIFVSFYGHFLMLPFSFLHRKKVVFHPFISTYETLVFDRQKFSAQSLPAKLAFWLDRSACHNASHILLDTQANIDFFSTSFSIPHERFSKILIGSDERIFFPRPVTRDDNNVVVLYHGSYLPLHGIDVIIQAAHILNDQPDILFRMVGRGPGYEHISSLTEKLNLKNIEFLESVPFEKLPYTIAGADICLGGHFGSSDKAARVIAGKTFQDIAMGKPTIVGDTIANRELLKHGYDAWFSKPNDPVSLANGIIALAKEPTLRILLGQNAHETFLKKASLKALVPEIIALLERVVG